MHLCQEEWREGYVDQDTFIKRFTQYASYESEPF
jgi:hypothetical protein